jgi:hypothetical protein
MQVQCSIPECEKSRVNYRGWCNIHYRRWQRYGDPTTLLRPWRVPAEQRFWENVAKSDGCWMWTGTKDPHGYGRFWTGTTIGLAHRWAYELLVGPIPTDLELDHLCRVTSCVKTEHLEPVTHAENMRRGSVAKRTHCPQGHPYTPENTYRYPVSGDRKCRICRTAQRRAFRVRTGR